MKKLILPLVAAILLTSCTKETPEQRDAEEPRIYTIKSVYFADYPYLSQHYGLQIYSGGISVYSTTHAGADPIYCQPNVTTESEVTVCLNTGGNWYSAVDTIVVNLDTIAPSDPLTTNNGKLAVINFE